MKIILANRYLYPDESATSRMTSSLAFALAREGFAVQGRQAGQFHATIATGSCRPARRSTASPSIAWRCPASAATGSGAARSTTSPSISVPRSGCFGTRGRGTSASCTDPSASLRHPGPAPRAETGSDGELAPRPVSRGRARAVGRQEGLGRPAGAGAARLVASPGPVQRGADRSDGPSPRASPDSGRAPRRRASLVGRRGDPADPAGGKSAPTGLGAGERLHCGLFRQFRARPRIPHHPRRRGAAEAPGRHPLPVHRRRAPAAAIEAEIRSQRLDNVILKPLQPRELLADSLGLADIHLVSLLPPLEPFVIPSKFYGILAAGRPTLFIGDPDGEIGGILQQHCCGHAVAIGDCETLARHILDLRNSPDRLSELSANARRLFETDYTEDRGCSEWTKLLSRFLPSMTSDAALRRTEAAMPADERSHP